MKVFFAALGAFAAIFLVAPHQLHAQVITNTEIDRGLTYPGPAASGAVSQFEKYNYNTGSFIYVCGDRNRLIYLDYLDRADRAAKFGYRMPVDPFFPSTSPIVSYPVAEEPVVGGFLSGGGGFGFFRRR